MINLPHPPLRNAMPVGTGFHNREGVVVAGSDLLMVEKKCYDLGFGRKFSFSQFRENFIFVFIQKCTCIFATISRKIVQKYNLRM